MIPIPQGHLSTHQILAIIIVIIVTITIIIDSCLASQSL